MNQVKTKLYALNKDGSFQQWRVCVNEGLIQVEFGKVGGKLQTKDTLCHGKNLGRANETSASEQAWAEGVSKWEKQYRLGYRETTDELKTKEQLSPMLAHDALKRKSAIEYPAFVQPKLDGCFTYATKILTNKGLLEIGDIVDNRLEVSVLSYDEVSKKCEYKKITNHFNNGPKNKSEWLRLGNNGITRNHKVLSKAGWETYGEVSEMLSPNPRYLGILCGMLLGDSVAAIEKRSIASSNPASWRLNYSVGKEDLSFGENKSKLLSEISYSMREYLSGYNKECVSFTSGALTNSPFPLSIFYNVDKTSDNFGKRCKNIDRKLLEQIFTDETLAIWYFDDGSLHYNNGNKDTPRIFLSVPRYSEKTVEGFVKLFENKYKVYPSVGYYGKDVRLSFSTKDSLYLLWKISSCLGQTFERKIPSGLTLSACEPQEEMIYVPTDHRNYSTPLESLCAYDIEVEDNHNYFANNKLVHNCRAIVTFDGLGDPVFNSRGNKTYPLQGEIVEQMKKLRSATGIDIFDGEVYLHGLSLQKIVSLAKKWRIKEDIEEEINKDYLTEVKKWNKNHELYVEPEVNQNKYGGYSSDDLEFHIFDIPSKKPWGINDGISDYKDTDCRLADLDNASEIGNSLGLSHLRFVDGHIVKDENETLLTVAENMQNGYEGSMIRNFKGVYEFGQRSSDLIKWKLFQDAEAKVVDVEKDKNAEGVLICHDQNGIIVKMKMKGTHQQRLYEEQLKLKGKFVNFTFQAKTDDNNYQFPVAQGVRQVDKITWEVLE